MVDYAKSRQKEGYDAEDFTTINFTATEQSYVIGTDAYNANPTGHASWAKNPPVTGQPGFMAQEIMFYCTTNCLVRFNGPSEVQELILANAYKTFYPKVHTIYVVRQAANGTLYVWSEG